MRLRDAARLGGGELAGVFAVRAVVDDDLGAGGGERLDMIAGERAGGGQTGRKLHQGAAVTAWQLQL